MTCPTLVSDAPSAVPRQRAFFFDRDGVVNASPGEGSYVLSWDNFHFLPGVHEVLSFLKANQFLLVLVTNQQCVGKGLLSEETLDSIHEQMQQALGEEAKFDAIYCSPHLKSENSPMTKPSSGMVVAATEKFGIDLTASWLVGDHDRDIQLAHNAGVGNTIRFVSEKEIAVSADFTVASHAELLALLKEKI